MSYTFIHDIHTRFIHVGGMHQHNIYCWRGVWTERRYESCTKLFSNCLDVFLMIQTVVCTERTLLYIKVREPFYTARALTQLFITGALLYYIHGLVCSSVHIGSRHIYYTPTRYLSQPQPFTLSMLPVLNIVLNLFQRLLFLLSYGRSNSDCCGYAV